MAPAARTVFLALHTLTLLLGLGDASDGAYSGDPHSLRRSHFPHDFVFGTSTSAYQVSIPRKFCRLNACNAT